MSLDYYKTSCLVCGNDGMGLHFGVETCRACAAFFRRSAFRKEDYTCRNQYSEGELCNESRILNCKHCRLLKCQKVGMTMKKKTKNASKQVIKRPETVEREEIISYCVWDPANQKPVKWIDIQPILRRSQGILEHYYLPLSLAALNPLERMTQCLTKLRSAQSKTPQITNFMIFDDYFTLWEEHMTRAAEFMMHSEEFRSLPIHEKLEFFKIIWAVWRRVERNSMSAEIYGQRCLDEKILLISDDTATRLGDFKMDVSEICQQGFEDYNRIMRKNLLQYFEAVSKPCLEWKFDETEITFIICQIVWNYAGRKLNGQSQTAADTFLEKISNNLHEFYTENWKISNYAGRLAVIMDVVNGVLKIQAEHEKVMEMAFLFDMFSIKISDPTFFCV